MVHEILVKIRRLYNLHLKRTLMIVIPVIIVLTAASVIVDMFLPMVGIGYNTIRLLIALPLAVSIYVIAYFISMKLHNDRVRNPEINWKPYRLRFSLMWRRRMAVIAAAFLFVMIYATNKSTLYTFYSSLIIAAGFAVVAFIRPTSREQKLSEMDIPDARDVDFELYLEKEKQAKEEAAEKRKNKKKKEPQKKVSKDDIVKEILNENEKYDK